MPTETIPAIYENGVLKPMNPLPLSDGTRVRVTVVLETPRSSTDSQRRSEMVAALDSLIETPDEDMDDGYDLLRSLDENRSQGERKLFPPELKDISW